MEPLSEENESGTHGYLQAFSDFSTWHDTKQSVSGKAPIFLSFWKISIKLSKVPGSIWISANLQSLMKVHFNNKSIPRVLVAALAFVWI